MCACQNWKPQLITGCYVARSYIDATTAEAVGILRGVINSYRSN